MGQGAVWARSRYGDHGKVMTETEIDDRRAGRREGGGGKRAGKRAGGGEGRANRLAERPVEVGVVYLPAKFRCELSSEFISSIGLFLSERASECEFE